MLSAIIFLEYMYMNEILIQLNFIEIWDDVAQPGLPIAHEIYQENIT